MQPQHVLPSGQQRVRTPPRKTLSAEEREQRWKIRENSLSRLAAGGQATTNSRSPVSMRDRSRTPPRTVRGSGGAISPQMPALRLDKKASPRSQHRAPQTQTQQPTDERPTLASSIGQAVSREEVIDRVSARYSSNMSAESQEYLRRELNSAREKFDDLDVDQNGVLNGEELHNLASWVLLSLGPGGKLLPKASRRAEAKKLLAKANESEGGQLDFWEFADWFGRTCASIDTFRQAQDARATRGVSPSRRQSRSRTPPRTLSEDTVQIMEQSSRNLQTATGGSPTVSTTRARLSPEVRQLLKPLVRQQLLEPACEPKPEPEPEPEPELYGTSPASIAGVTAATQAHTLQAEGWKRKIVLDRVMAAARDAGLDAIALVRTHADSVQKQQSSAVVQTVANGRNHMQTERQRAQVSDVEQSVTAAAMAPLPSIGSAPGNRSIVTMQEQPGRRRKGGGGGRFSCCGSRPK